MSTVEAVQSKVMAGLLRGEIRPGTWLRQDALADELGVSKIPVREALQRLAAIGLLRFETNRGAFVSELTAADAHENYGLRRAIEPLLLVRAIPNLTIDDLAEAEITLSDANTSITESNWAFHRSLYRASGWKRGIAMTETLHAAVAPYVAVYTQELGGARTSDSQHVEILNACRAGSTQQAHDLLVQHLDQAAAALREFLTDPARESLLYGQGT